MLTTSYTTMSLIEGVTTINLIRTKAIMEIETIIRKIKLTRRNFNELELIRCDVDKVNGDAILRGIYFLSLVNGTQKG